MPFVYLIEPGTDADIVHAGLENRECSCPDDGLRAGPRSGLAQGEPPVVGCSRLPTLLLRGHTAGQGLVIGAAGIRPNLKCEC